MTITKKQEAENVKMKIEGLTKIKHQLTRDLDRVNGEIQSLTNTRLALLKDV